MNKLKFSDNDYIDFLIASPYKFSCTEAARVQPKQANPDELWKKTASPGQASPEEFLSLMIRHLTSHTHAR